MQPSGGGGGFGFIFIARGHRACHSLTHYPSPLPRMLLSRRSTSLPPLLEVPCFGVARSKTLGSFLAWGTPQMTCSEAKVGETSQTLTNPEKGRCVPTRRDNCLFPAH